MWFGGLRPFFYQHIVIDPPWGFDLYSEAGGEKSAMAHYDVMEDEAVLELPVGRLAAENCLLKCWATAPKLPLAIEAVRAWGFQYKSYMVWHKVTKNAKTRLGTGFRVRTTGEIVIVATIGNPVQAIRPPTIFNGVAREHSRKPDEFYALCEKIMPNARRCDVFARERRPGWDVFGDEMDKFAGAAC